MKPNDTCHRLIFIRNRSTGAGVAGVVIGDLTVTAANRGYAAAAFAAFTHAATLTAVAALGDGWYDLAHAAPPAAGWWRLAVKHATHDVWSASWEGEVESQDFDSLFASIVRGVALPTRGATLGLTVPGELVAYRYNQWIIPITDQAGAAVDLTAYGTFRLSVRSKNQTTKVLDAQDGTPTGFGLTGDAAGLLTITWPESTGTTGTAADIYSWLAAGALSADPLYYEVTADLGSDATKTVPIIRSSELRITRREVGA